MGFLITVSLILIGIWLMHHGLGWFYKIQCFFGESWICPA